jgi:Mg2+ and Co2+ transporter CorA
MTVLLMPATLVTGFFGMNTETFTHGWGTALAGLVAAGPRRPLSCIAAQGFF